MFTNCLLKNAYGLALLSGAIFGFVGGARAESPARTELRPAPAVTSNPAWRESLHEFDEWLSAQAIYSPEEAAQIKTELQDRLATMTTDESEDFRRDLESRLAIVSSAEWQETMDWVSSTLSAAAPAYARKLNLHYPDVAHLTAAQLQRELHKLERRRWSEHQESLAYEHLRETRLAMHRRQLRADAEARERALDRASTSNRFAEYHPSHHPPQRRNRRPFYPPRVFGFGFGFGGLGFF